MNGNRLLPLLLACAVALGEAAPATSQEIPRSQQGTISQMVAGTRIDVRYRRPVARGRVLFGDLVPWGQVWTPSADSAAQVTVSTDVEINGQRLAAGSYALWTIPDAASWTIIFNSRVPVFHLRYPADRDVLRVASAPVVGEHVETLQFSFPMVDADSALLHIRWGTTVVPVRIRAAASPPR